MRQGETSNMTNTTTNIIDPGKIITQVLSIAGYEGDKKEYADKFLGLCQEDIVYTLLESLPEEKQNAIKEELKDKKSYEDLQKVINENFTPDEVFKVSERITKEAFKSILDKVTPTLDSGKKDVLKAYFKSFNEE